MQTQWKTGEGGQISSENPSGLQDIERPEGMHRWIQSLKSCLRVLLVLAQKTLSILQRVEKRAMVVRVCRKGNDLVHQALHGPDILFRHQKVWGFTKEQGLRVSANGTRRLTPG